MSTIVGGRTLRSLLEHRARQQPDSIFVIFDGLDGNPRQLGYAAFDEQANRAADVLAALGQRAGDTIHLHLPNCLAFLYLWFGAAKAGVRIMPTNPLASVDELAYLAEHSCSRVLFTAPDLLEVGRAVLARVSRLARIVVCTDVENALPGGVECFEQRMDAATPRPPAHRPGPDDEVGILYTSGTTARPKGVLVSNANYIYAGETVAKHLAMRHEDRQLAVLPLFHGNAQYYSTMSTLVTGSSMVLAARFSASAYFDQAIAHRATLASLFAAPMRMILAQPENPAHRDNCIRAIIFAQCITEAQLEQWQQRFATPLMQIWGMTETMGPPLMNPLNGERRNMGIGLPSMGYAVRLVDEGGCDVACGEVGQIVVRGVGAQSLMSGYFDNPEASAATLRDGWLWSGDNARQDDDGYFHFVDRVKDMIKRSGENVAASEVEAVVLQHPAVFDCAVVGVPDAMRDEAIKAVVVLKEGASADEMAIIEFCAARLARFRVPQVVEFRDSLPRTSVGKIQKHLLRQEPAS